MGTRLGALAPIRVVVLGLLPYVASAQGIIATPVGRDWVFPVNVGSAQNAPLGRVEEVAVDKSGNIFVADADNEMVFRISPAGDLTVVAGNGIRGFSGDNGPATSASLNAPSGIAVDDGGTVYIADSRNHRVRRVGLNGFITTVAGTGTAGYSGDGRPGISASLSSPKRLTLDRAGNLYILDYGNVVVRKLTGDDIITTVAGNTRTGFAGDGGPATGASFDNPGQLAVDNDGGLYIADTNNNRIRKVSTSGIISTVVGNGDSSFSAANPLALDTPINGPSGLAVSPSGVLYFTDRFHERIRAVSLVGIVITVAGTGDSGKVDGPALQASFRAPFGLALDAFNNLYIADYGNKLVRRLSAGLVSTFAGNGQYRPLVEGAPATTAFLFNPIHATTDPNGNIYITDTDNARVLKVSPTGNTTTVAGTSTDGRRVNLPCTPNDRAISLNFPSAVAPDSNGNLYLADFGPNVVYKITPDSRICPFAGGAKALGDGGPATSASLGTVFGIAFDSRGNLFIADTGNNRIRRVAPNGTITTFAGNGQPGFGGDNGPARNALLNQPYGVAVDTSGNVYIADRLNNRIRRVTPDCLSGSGDCIIITVAGNGNQFFSGDGGPATSAAIWSPWDVAVDRDSSLLIADFENNRIRKVTTPGPNGIITTVAGTGASGFFGDGGPAINAFLNHPTGVTTKGDGTILIVDQGNNCIRAIAATPVINQLQISQTQLSFVGTSGGTKTSQAINVTSSLAGLPFTISAVSLGTSDWFQITPGSGNAPAQVQVTADPGKLQPGTYQATVTVTSPYATPTVRTISVSFQVNNAPAPAPGGGLSLDVQALTFTFTGGGGQESTQLSISNQGGGTIAFTASATTTTGGDWLLVSPASGTVSALGPAQVTVTAGPGSLGAGTYSGSIIISIYSMDTGDNITLPVTMAISTAPQKILLSQTGLTFTSVEQAGAPLPQSFGILNAGQGSMSWTAVTTTLSGGSSWLSIDRTSGTVVSPYTDVSLVNVTINPAGLTAGSYYGQVQVKAAGAANSPQTVSVVLNVLPPGSNPGPELRPTGLIFAGGLENATLCLRNQAPPRGASLPGMANPSATCLPSQTVIVSNPGAIPLNFASSPTYLSANGWLQYVPTNATVAPGQPANLIVQPDLTNLPMGTQRAAVTLLFADGSIRTVSVLTVIAPGRASAASAELETESRCSPLLVHPTDVPSSVTEGQPASIGVRVVDNCGSIVTNAGGAVTSTFSNGDPRVNLVHVGNGNWGSTWTPRNASQSRVAIQINAFSSQGTQTAAGVANVPVSVQTGGAAPLTFAAANAASGEEIFVAPGSLVSIYGLQLAEQPGQPGSVPFPTQVNGTQVLMGGIPMPLRYVSSGQVNAQVPFDLPINSAQQLIVRRGTTVSVPQDVVVAAAQPGVYTQDGSGSGVGVIVNGCTNELITSANPAATGDVVVIYANGLGAVSPPVPTGTPAPSVEPLARIIYPVSVTMQGRDAVVNFAGLAPGYPDLYQVNAVVPAGLDLPDADAISVTLTVAGKKSRPVSMPKPKPGPPGGPPGLQCAPR